jgi:hypothetical protein
LVAARLEELLAARHGAGRTPRAADLEDVVQASSCRGALRARAHADLPHVISRCLARLAEMCECATPSTCASSTAVWLLS